MNALGVSEVTLSKHLSMHTNDEISDTDIRFLHCILYRKLFVLKKKKKKRSKNKVETTKIFELKSITDGISFDEGNF